jgi:small subunit ribosomal protein S11
MAREKKAPKRKERKNIAAGVAHVNSSFNNTKILISDVQGNAIAWSSSGTMGFKGSQTMTKQLHFLEHQILGFLYY